MTTRIRKRDIGRTCILFHLQGDDRFYGRIVKVGYGIVTIAYQIPGKPGEYTAYRECRSPRIELV